MSDTESTRRALLMAAPLLLAVVAASDNTVKTDKPADIVAQW